MTIADVVTPSPDAAASPPGRRGLQWTVRILIAMMLAACGAVVAGTYYYDSVPMVDYAVPEPTVRVADLPPPVANAFVAATDPDFYHSPSGIPLNPSLITRRYMVIASGGGAESSWRIRVMADKAEDEYTQAEILHRYLNSADYGRGAVGLATAARTYFKKPAGKLTVAEAASLAVRLRPDQSSLPAQWGQVLDTMVGHGWLAAAERKKLTFPG